MTTSDESKEIKKEELEKIPGLVSKFFTNMQEAVRQINVRQGIDGFSGSGWIATAVLLVIFIGISLIELPIVNSFIQPDPLRLLYSVFVALIVTIVWFTFGVTLGPKMGRFLVTNKIARMVFTKGNYYYFEFLPEEDRKIAVGDILAKVSVIIIGWLSISASMISLLVGTDRMADFVQDISSNLIIGIFAAFIVFFLAPLILALFLPASWMLLDVNMKAYDTNQRVSWLIGSKVKNRISGIISVGSIAIAAGAIGFSTIEKIMAIVDLFLLVLSWVGLSAVLIVFFYSFLFTAGFYLEFLNTIDIPVAETGIVEKERDRFIAELAHQVPPASEEPSTVEDIKEPSEEVFEENSQSLNEEEDSPS